MSEHHRPSALSHLAPVALLLLLFAQLISSVGLKSPTMDEQNHLARGLAYLKTGDLRLSKEHPPGVNVWEAWPLLLDPGIRLPFDSPSWANGEWYGFADLLLWRVNDHPQAMIFATRVPVMWLTLLLAALVWRWAGELGGLRSAILATTLIAFDPNILAHGRLTTTDMGVTALTLATAYALWHASRQRHWTAWIWAGATLGGALLSKFSALVLVPAAILLVMATPPRERGFPARSAASAALLLLVGGLVVWAGYRFTWGPIAFLGGISGPAPAYWAGIQAILRRTGGGTPAFLLGQYSERGWWYYFPIAFAIKTPLPTLILLGAAAWQAIIKNKEQPQHNSPLPFLLLPAAAFWGMAIGSSFNIGYRHILPTLPLLYVAAGSLLREQRPTELRQALLSRLIRYLIPGRQASPTPPRLEIGSAGRQLCISALIGWLIADTLLIAPHYLTFFNALAGGAEGGRRFLADSNLDWGQDLPGLKKYVEEQGIERVNLSWFGAAHPEAYDLRFHPLPGFWRFRGAPEDYGLNPLAPAPGTYAISVSNLQGVALSDRDTYAWFRAQKPVASIGHSILIYKVTKQAGEGQAVVLGLPTAWLKGVMCPPLPQVSSVRRYDPSSGIVWPAADVVWFVAPEKGKWGQEVYRGPGYVVSRATNKELPTVGPAMGNCQFVTLRRAQVTTLRARVVHVRAWWQVERPPHRAAVSFAHLLDAQGRYVAGWDGLTAPATCWQTGDLIRQDYTITAPSPGRYRIELGWYDAENGRRWSCANGEKSEERLWLPDVIVP